jgi:hypothetical protein
MDPEEAAADAVDKDRLLEGEDPSSQYRDDAEHWTRVYAELLEYKRQIMGVTRQAIDEMDKRAAQEIEGTDLQVIATEAQRFARRLEFWRQRLDELNPPA